MKANEVIRDYKDPLEIRYKLIRMREYNVLILFKEELYFDLFEELCSKRKYFSPYLFHYIFTQLFGYSDRAYKSFLNRWVKH